MAGGFLFPFCVADGAILPDTDDDADVRGRIIQLLFTTPGERVNQPEFGCGLLNLVFEPNDSVLMAATEFTVAQALNRWLRDDILVNQVRVALEEERLLIEVIYTRRDASSPQALRVQF